MDDEWELEEVSIKLLKGIKIKEATKIVFKDYSLDCKHFSIDLSRYILRRSKKDQNIYILETIVSQEPPSIRFQLVDNSTLKEKLLYKLKQRVFLKHIDTLNQKVDAPQ